MYLITPEQYSQLKRPSEDSSLQGPNSKVMKMHEEIRLAKTVDQNQREKRWTDLEGKLRPMFQRNTSIDGGESRQSDNNVIDSIAGEFPEKRQKQVIEILQVIQKIPNVILTKNRIILNGKPLPIEADDVVRKILRNKLSSPFDIAGSLYSMEDREDSEWYGASGVQESPMTPIFSKIKKHTPRKKVSDFESELKSHGFVHQATPGYFSTPVHRSTPTNSGSEDDDVDETIIQKGPSPAVTRGRAAALATFSKQEFPPLKKSNKKKNKSIIKKQNDDDERKFKWNAYF